MTRSSLPSKVTARSVHSRRSSSTCSSIRLPSGREVLAQRFVLDRVPTEPDPEAEAAAGQQVDLRGLLGDERGLALREDDDAGHQLDRGDRGEVAEHHERLVEGRVHVVGALPRRVHQRVGADHVVVGQDVREAELVHPLVRTRAPRRRRHRARSGGTRRRCAWERPSWAPGTLPPASMVLRKSIGIGFAKSRKEWTLPIYDEFQGTIGTTHHDSTPWFLEAPHPGDGAPNVVVILLDDTGFAHFGCYGSEIDTPNIDALAANGLQYTNFHVTPLCSPTRAALLTGRNHHSVGMRCLANFNTGFPNMTGHISNHAGTVAEVLREEGYTTFAVGKWHLCQMADASSAGPFDQWPLQRGFDRFYGFLEGETDQYSPDLTYDNHRVDAPATAEEGYHLSEDLVDRAVGFIHDAVSVRPDRPFFCYLAFGATHAPHQAPPDYMAKYRGRFDAGWDVAREQWFARQLERGLVPEGTELAPAIPASSPGTSSPRTSASSRRGCRRRSRPSSITPTTRSAGSSTSLREIGQLDNTLLFVLADNGASQEGGPFGVLHEMKFFNGILETPTRRSRRSTRSVGRTAIELPVGLGAGRQHAVQVVQAEHARGWRPRPADRALAERHRRARRHPAPVPPRERHRAVDLRRGRRAAAGGVPRARADAGHGNLDAVHVRRADRAEPQGPCSTSRWPGTGASTRTGGRPSRSIRAACRTTTTCGSCTTSTRTSPSATTSPPRCPRSSASSSSCGGARRRRTTCCHSTTGSSSCSAHGSRTAPRIPPTAGTRTGRRCRRCPRRPRPRSEGGAGT